jgi:hypothetical protein
MIAVMGLALAAIVVLIWDKFTDKLYRPVRAGIISCIGLSDNKGKLSQNIKLENKLRSDRR